MRTRSPRTTRNAARPSPFAAGLAMLLVLPMSTPGHAQDMADPDLASVEAGVIELETVTVTARRGEERAKDVPFGISVVSGEDIEAERLRDVEDVLRATPGVDVNSTGNANDMNIRIRGVGALYQATMDDASVVLNIDGVSMSSRHLSLGTLDVERVEVLKGPQGTLFGRNSEAGAINITTRKPTPYFEGHVRGEYGEEAQHLEEAVFSGPLSDQLSGRIAIRNTGAEHWVDNAQTGDPIGDPTEWMYRASLLWKPSVQTSALATAERQHSQENIALLVKKPFGDRPTIDITPGVFDDNEKTIERYSLEIDHVLATSRITSVTALTAADFFAVKAFDRDLAPLLFPPGFVPPPGEVLADDRSDERVLSQELRWSSLPDANVFWVAGLYLSDAERTFDSTDSFGRAFERDFSTETYAVFGETTYPLADKLKLTAGLRYTWDRKSYDGRYQTGGPPVEDEREFDDDYATGRLALSYAVTPTTNLYGTFARGYKSAGFSDYATGIADSEPYASATVNTFELGFKSATEDGRFSLDGAIFYNDVSDDHLQGFDPSTFATNIVNADTRSAGAELQGSWSHASGFGAAAALTYVDATITKDVTGVYGGDVDSGNRMPDVPRFKGTLSLSYNRAMPGFLGLDAPVLDARIDYRYVGERPVDAQNHADLDPYNKLDLRLGVLSGPFEIYAWADNLLDEQYDLYGFYETNSSFGLPPVEYGAPARGRTLGLGLSYHF